eukprot:9189059-Ditylum_brightwellii.AAC.1
MRKRDEDTSNNIVVNPKVEQENDNLNPAELKENMTVFEDDSSNMDEPKNAIEMQDKPEIKPKRPKRSKNAQKKTAKKEKNCEKMNKKQCTL